MDSNGIRLNDHAEIMYQPSKRIVKQESLREIDATKTTPAPDSRYPAYAARMDDGRLVTDYRQACVSRAPPGTQFAVKQWIVHNTDELIRISRLRQVQNTGQAFGTVRTELAPASYQQCTTEKCKIYSSENPDGIGIERVDRTPPLFGTFNFYPDKNIISKNVKHTELNKNVEYGANTYRRWENYVN